MQVHPSLEQVQEQLRAAAALGDERTKQIADALATAAGPAVRLAILDALTQAAGEITTALLDYPGSPGVSVRLDGEDITVDVHASVPPDAPAEARRDDGEPTARISLRLTETLKSDIDTAAERDGISVNNWLVRAATAALDPNPFLSWFNAGFGPGGHGRPRQGGNNPHRVTGWING
jgi:uncharacterized protein (DUF1778 family)